MPIVVTSAMMSFAGVFLNILKTCSENIKLSSVRAYTKIVISNSLFHFICGFSFI